MDLSYAIKAYSETQLQTFVFHFLQEKFVSNLFRLKSKYLYVNIIVRLNTGKENIILTITSFRNRKKIN